MTGSSTPQTRPVNLADIAAEVGVSMMTVSLALRDHPRISPATKAKVCAKAEELGYVRDPELSRLMAYIRNRQPGTLKANMGFLHCFPKSFGPQVGLYIWNLYEAAREHADTLGYSLDLLCLTEKGMTRRRMTQILDTRNIHGVLVAPLPHGVEIQPAERMDSSRVAGVTVGYSVIDPRYSRVTLNHYHAMNMAMDRLWESGYRRIGLALDAFSSARVRDLWLAGFTAWQFRRFQGVRVSPLIIQKDWKGAIGGWMENEQPDVVLIQAEEAERALAALGYRCPEDVGLAYLNANFQSRDVGGIVQSIRSEGRLAVEFLISQILARKNGVPEDNVTIMVKGSWRTGSTLRERVRSCGGDQGEPARMSRPGAASS